MILDLSRCGQVVYVQAYKGLYFIKMLTWKFIRSFACVDGDMDKAKPALTL
jgi:hypothetical protein